MEIAVTVHPFYLDLTPEELALLVQRRIDTSEVLAGQLLGKDRREIEEEVQRLRGWLENITQSVAPDITLAVVESRQLDEAAAEQAREGPRIRLGGPIC